MVSEDLQIRVIDMTERSWRLTIDRIVSCDVVVSSSLHGIIAAEAYGIPAVWVQPSGRLVGGRCKFHDYLAGTGRECAPAVWSRGIGTLVDRLLPTPRFNRLGLRAAARATFAALPWSQKEEPEVHRSGN